MKRLVVPFLETIRYDSPWDSLKHAFADIPKTVIGEKSWPEFSYTPNVSVRIGYTIDALVLLFSVDEDVAQAIHRHTHDPVHKDSCVEFFISFDEGDHYYNLEFNCLGTRMVAYGKEVVAERKKLPVGLAESIRIKSSIDESLPLADQGTWELMAVVPYTLFLHERQLEIAGRTVTGNFYKCGDDLPKPHFLAWNRINYPAPNFHKPADFGKLSFQSE